MDKLTKLLNHSLDFEFVQAHENVIVLKKEKLRITLFKFDTQNDVNVTSLGCLSKTSRLARRLKFVE